jgi:predicted nucleic acid-binding protein
MLIIDASVALKWALPEAGSDRARDLLANEVLAAPELLAIECANVLWAKARRKQISAADAQGALAGILAAPVTLLASAALTAQAQDLALALDHPAYDCLYLATAIAERATLVTADEVFVKVVLAHGAYSSGIRLLLSARRPREL